MSFKLIKNPTNEITNLRIKLPVESTVSIYITDVLGNRINDLLINRLLLPGSHEIPVDVSNFKPGIYFLHLLTTNQNEAIKLVKVE